MRNNVNRAFTFLAAVPLLAGVASAAGLESLYWDTSDAPGLQGGTGVWSATARNWNASADGSGPRVAWHPGAVAVFRSPEKQLVLAEGAPGSMEVGGIEAAAVDVAGAAISFPKSGLEVTTDGEVTLSSALRGPGPVVKRGKGMLTVCGINSLPGGFTLVAGRLRFFSPEALGQGALRVEGVVSLIPGAANMGMDNPVSIKPGARLVIDTETPEFTVRGPVAGGGVMEKTGHVKLVVAGTFDPAVRLIGSLGTLEFRPARPVKLEATIRGGLLRAAAGSLAEGSKLLISQAGALAASGACKGVQAWVESGWIAPESDGTLAWDGEEEVGGTLNLKPFVGRYPAMSLGSCGRITVTGRLELPGSVLRIGGGGGDVDIRAPLTGPLQLIIGAPSTTGRVTLSATNTFTGGLRIDGGVLRIGNPKAIPAGVIVMGNRFTGLENCQFDLNDFDLPNAVKLEGVATLANAGGHTSILSGRIAAGSCTLRLAPGKGSCLRHTGTLDSQGTVIVNSDKPVRADPANLVELAPATPNAALRIQVERGTVLRAVDGLGLPNKARLVLYGGVFESHGEFSRALVPQRGARDGEGGVSFIWDRYTGSGFSAHGGALTVRLSMGAQPLTWGAQADGSLKPDDYLLVLNAPTADSPLFLDVPLDLAGEQLDRKGNPTPLHRITVQAAEAVLTRPVSNSGGKPASLLKLGKGTLVLKAANAFENKMIVREGGLAFGSPAALAGTGRTICPGNGTVVAANYPIDNAFLRRLESPSAMAFTVALGADSAEPLDFHSATGAILRAATLGATRTATYSGFVTPCDGKLRLGGGGGTLVVGNPANVPATVGGALTPGRVVLPEGTSLPRDFALLDGTLAIGARVYAPPDIPVSRPSPALPAEPSAVTASASDRWVDAVWSFPVDPEGGFAVEWSGDGKTFTPAGTAWPAERRFPVFLEKPPRTFFGAPGEVFVRVAALGGDGTRGAWSGVARTRCARRYNVEKAVPAQFPGSADQRRYSAADPERLVTYTPAEKAAQRARASEIADRLKALSNTTGREFVIPPGIYRVNVGQFAVEGAQNLTLRAPGVELIVDDERSGGVFSFAGCHDIVLTGRGAGSTGLILDSEQLAFSLARILAVNSFDGTLDVEILPGYDTGFPELERMLAYRPDGSMANTQQMGWNKFQSLGGRLFRLNSIAPLIAQNQNMALKPGNLLVMHISDAHKTRTHGLVSTRDCGNMTYESIRVVDGGGSPGDARTAGHTIYRDWRNSPRPGTSRLEICAGLGQFGKEGGAFLFEDCEFGPHLDDGINLGSTFGMALRQTGATSLVIAGIEPTPGQTLTFHDFYSWDKVGEAKIVASTPLREPESLLAVDEWCERNRITSMALQHLWNVTLDRPVRPTPFAPVIHSNHRCDSVTVRGCLFRDQLAQIMLLQGAKSGLIENNLLLRSPATAVSMQFSQYWWEGPQPANFIVRNNVIRDNPVSATVTGKDGTGSIGVFACTVRGGDSGRYPLSESEPVLERLFSGFRIEGNTIVNPGAYGILLRNTRNAVIRRNRIVNPGAAGGEQPFAAIGLDQVSDTIVEDNEVVLGKWSAPEAVALIGGCVTKTLRIENNTVIPK